MTDLAEMHFSTPRISALLSDMKPDAASTISWKEKKHRIIITFADVPQVSRQP